MSEGKWKQVDAGLLVRISPADEDDLKIPGMAELYEKLSRLRTHEANRSANAVEMADPLAISEAIVQSVQEGIDHPLLNEITRQAFEAAASDSDEKQKAIRAKEKAIYAEIQALKKKHQN